MNNAAYLSPSGAASRLALHEESIRRLVREGKLQAIKIGRRIRIPIEALTAFESAHRMQRGSA